MAAPYNNLRSKTNRAIAAYLVSVGAGGPDDVLPANSRKPVSYPYTLVKAVSSKPECQLGPRRITVHVSIKGSAVQDPTEPNADQSRLDFDERVATTFDALMQSDDDQTLRYTARAITAAGQALAVPVDNTPAAVQFAANNADMADFNCQAWYEVLEGDGEPDKEGTSWTQVLVFESLCQADALDSSQQFWTIFGDQWAFNRTTGVYKWLDKLGDGLWHVASIVDGQFVYEPAGTPEP